ncbi:uncharacterized protein K02A2.6-like [Octopus sinensis]|uniref:Uncharacterized protein K02A2.6-like n=1 Tax=Octopus sinensis TaxID=2607531 RepID=A0A6P7SMS1_9MOLL|nr:uncharacterized protein K02A2.6-like [Octopus sinensis]
MAECLVNSKEDLLQSAANAKGFNKNGLESAHKFRTRPVNEKEETLLQIAFYWNTFTVYEKFAIEFHLFYFEHNFELFKKKGTMATKKDKVLEWEIVPPKKWLKDREDRTVVLKTYSKSLDTIALFEKTLPLAPLLVPKLDSLCEVIFLRSLSRPVKYGIYEVVGKNWSCIDAAIKMAIRRCDSCGEHQNKPSKPVVHPCMLSEKRWSRLHMALAINFMGTNWLVITDTSSRYPSIHSTSSCPLDLLDEVITNFRYLHTLVTDNASTFFSEEVQSWGKEHGTTHLTGAPYYPTFNGSAERLVQLFKQALRKSSLPLKQALQEFLMQYQRTLTSCGLSPGELLMSRQIRTRSGSLLPPPEHTAQDKQIQGVIKGGDDK